MPLPFLRDAQYLNHCPSFTKKIKQKITRKHKKNRFNFNFYLFNLFFIYPDLWADQSHPVLRLHATITTPGDASFRLCSG